MLTHKGKLIHGIEIDGAVYVDFEMREATIRDAINAVDKLTEDGENLNSSNMVQLYMAAEQILSIGPVSKEAITAGLLLDLADDDLEPILDAQDEVAKKRKDAKKSSSVT